MAYYMTTPNFLWKIENFCTYKRVSPTMFIRGFKWQCTFSEFVEAGTEKVHLILECLSSSEAFSYLSFRAESCIMFGGDHYDKSKQIITFTLKHKRLCIWSDTLQNFRGYGSYVTFFVTVIPLGNLTDLLQIRGNDEEKYMSHCAVNLMEDISKLFNNEEHSDFTLKCGESKFYVHKAVLAARSDYFAAMFRNDMKGSSEGNGNIQNIEPDIMELVLRYLYTGEIPELPNNSLRKVLFAAEMLLVEPLTTKCHSLLIDNFTNGSKGDSQMKTSNEQSASVKQSETVKEEILDIEDRQIIRNLFVSSEWKLFEQKFPQRARELYRPFLEKL